MRVILRLATRAEQPGVNVVRHGPEAFVADALAVDGGHARDLMPHDVVGRGLVLRLVGYSAEGMAEGVETAMAVDAERVEQLPHFLGNGGGVLVLRPRLAVL